MSLFTIDLSSFTSGIQCNVGRPSYACIFSAEIFFYDLSQKRDKASFATTLYRDTMLH